MLRCYLSILNNDENVWYLLGVYLWSNNFLKYIIDIVK